MISDQVLEIVDIGIVIIDENFIVLRWNPWMEQYSGVSSSLIVERSLFDFYPHLKESARFIRYVKSVFSFKNVAFLSQKLHKYIFPMKPRRINSGFEFMQQSCTMGPLRDDEGRFRYLYIMVYDVTDLATTEQENKKLSVTDGLTGAFNRRFFENRLREEFERQSRYRRPLSLIMLDIDFFKQVNDTYGHLAGDFILKGFAEKIKNRIRSVDIIARYGGEEFCCLLPETDSEEALKLSESIRILIEGTVFDYNGTLIKITVSQGVSEIMSDSDTPEKFIQRADSALYVSKETGRNRVSNGNLICLIGDAAEKEPLLKENGCPKCGAAMHFIDNPLPVKCDVCKKNRVPAVRCENGHFICDPCQNKRLFTLIQNICLSTSETDMTKLLEYIVDNACIGGSSPGYHLAVPAVILATYRNLGGSISDSQIKSGMERSRTIPFGSCGFSGICAASAGVGIALGIILESSPDKARERNLLVRLAGQINEKLSHTDPENRCYKNVNTALVELARVSGEILPIKLVASKF